MPTEHPLILRLRARIDLTEAERLAVGTVSVRRETVAADQAILREGARPTRCFALEKGFACSSKIVRNGARQIVAIHIPGDVPDLTSLHLKLRDTDLWALTSCEVGYMDHAEVQWLCNEHPRIAWALWHLTLVDGAIFREWVVNVGQREGLSRVAHLLCELMARMEAAGLARDGQCPLGVTQDDLAQATGLSHVHVNRMLQELRRRRLLSFGRRRLAVHDWPGLVEVADFRADYLHLGEPAAA